MTVQLYANTKANATYVGWAKLPEHCIGDEALPVVLHDTKKGTFTFMPAPCHAPMTKLILVGMLACSNMGQEIRPDDVTHALEFPPRNVSEAASIFTGHLIETEDQEHMFEEEAKMWEKKLAPMSNADIEKSWPHIADKYRAA